MKNIIWFAIVVLTLSSCKKWLDVTPQTKVSADDLFKTSEGFEEALTGVYSSCTNMNLYGLELTVGLPEVLAQNYMLDPQDFLHYRQTAAYNYTDRYYIAKKDTVWSGLYNGIANCNLLLKNIEEHGDVLSADRRQLIKGEALGLRAFLHFDLLRLFAPSFKSNPGAKVIPYVTDFSNKTTTLASVAEVLTKAADDLQQAKELMRPVDPILTAGYKVGYNADDTASTEQSSSVLFLQNRRHRLNYYAVCGELARVNLYMDKKSEALSNALEVINSKKFPFTKTADFLQSDPQKKDRILYKELLFAWYVPNMKDTLGARFGTATKGLYIEKNACDYMYEKSGVGGDDQRPKQWFNLLGTNYEILKYKRDFEKNLYDLVLPALRLSEMYYIASESAYDTDPATAVGFLNTVRASRGINTPVTVTSKDELITELVNDARKEMYAEGQIFYMYKRLNRTITGLLGYSSIPPGDKVFVMPLPVNEIEFGQR